VSANLLSSEPQLGQPRMIVGARPGRGPEKPALAFPDRHVIDAGVPAGHQPTIAEAVARLNLLRERGPTPEAFTFGEAFKAPDADEAGERFSFNDTCPA